MCETTELCGHVEHHEANLPSSHLGSPESLAQLAELEHKGRVSGSLVPSLHAYTLNSIKRCFIRIEYNKYSHCQALQENLSISLCLTPFLSLSLSLSLSVFVSLSLHLLSCGLSPSVVFFLVFHTQRHRPHCHCSRSKPPSLLCAALSCSSSSMFSAVSSRLELAGSQRAFSSDLLIDVPSLRVLAPLLGSSHHASLDPNHHYRISSQI